MHFPTFSRRSFYINTAGYLTNSSFVPVLKATMAVPLMGIKPATSVMSPVP
uniref:Uncharacterized protein n=1 Tax=Anguilla anguilla TaxID=7936 RepID=A0A0E9WBK2_ANGAN